jgi:glycosyltransferase involved in cell wall biosynthesis
MTTGLQGERLSVIMAVWNGERYIREALDSLLAQSRPAEEIVVVDDGSTDRTPEILAAYGPALRVVRQENAGSFAAINRGIAACTGTLLTFLDHDDLCTPSSLACRREYLEAHPELDGVFGLVEQFVSPELGPEVARRYRLVLGPRPVELLVALMVRRQAFDRVGPLDASRRTKSNIDWISRSRHEGLRLATLPELVARRRVHTSNISLQATHAGNTDLLAVVRAHHRRRQARASLDQG